MKQDADIVQTSVWPVKSMAHYHPGGARIHGDLRFTDGLCQDRQFMVVEGAPHTHINYNPGTVSETGRFISQREDPVLTQFSAELTEQKLVLRYNNHGDIDTHTVDVQKSSNTPLSVSVWAWEGFGVDQGKEAAKWLGERIGRPVRLVRVDNSRPRFVQDDPSKGKVGFADGYPVLVAGTASLDRVNQVLDDNGNPTVGLDRFRANIVLQTEEAFVEDSLKELVLTDEHGRVRLVADKLCGRCPIPDIDQVSGEIGRAVRSALRKAGRVGTSLNYPKPGTFFGMNMIIAEVQGDPIVSTESTAKAIYGSTMFAPKAQTT